VPRSRISVEHEPLDQGNGFGASGAGEVLQRLVVQDPDLGCLQELHESWMTLEGPLDVATLSAKILRLGSR